MLRSASLELATRSRRLTSVARTRRSLSTLDRDWPAGAGAHDILSLDWTMPGLFLEGIKHHVARTGGPDLVVAWMHDDALTLRIAARLAEDSPIPRFFHIIGSATVNPLKIADSLRMSAEATNLNHYHQIVLGGHGSGRRGRWLTDWEISRGVLQAVERQKPMYVVGTLERWTGAPIDACDYQVRRGYR